MSRSLTNEDQMHYMMISSDPLVSSLRSPQTEKRATLPHGVLNLLVSGDPIKNKKVDSGSDNGKNDEIENSGDSDSECEEGDEIENSDPHFDASETLMEHVYDDSDITLPVYYHSEYDVNFLKYFLDRIFNSKENCALEFY